ncbi:hypothetical protein Bca52824_086551 [Brassica carinata]|uniref:Uncharacterized protein n=1 Tax=Brassica carinata TaxID=52824 RepID=A0A8X7PAF4_BRACI|nr:hypothetical protein Bca52824_086551 [Brassica carinata]
MSEASPLLVPKTNSPVSSEPMANKPLTGLETNKVMSSILVALCSFSCVFSCFTDCFKGTDGSRKYGTVTKKGLWTYADPGSVDLSKYKIRIADFVHAVFVVSVFGTLVLLDRKVHTYKNVG